MRVRKFGLFGDDSLQRSNGRLEVFIVDIALSFLEQIVKGVGDFLGLRLSRRLGLRRIMRHWQRITLRGRSLLRPCREKQWDAKDEQESPHRVRTERSELHGSAGGILAPLETAGEGPAGLDAPFAERFAWPFPLSIRAR